MNNRRLLSVTTAMATVLAVAFGQTAALAEAAGQPASGASGQSASGASGDSPLEQLLIIGDRSKRALIPGSATYIGPDELEEFEYQDIMRILRLAPGVNVQEEEGFGLRPNIGLRGTTVERSSQITLMEDGVLIAPAPYAAPDAYYFPTPGRLEAVEVAKGSSAIRFGPRTVGGAINLLSRSIPEERDRLSGFVETRFGELDWLTVHAAGGGTFGVDAGIVQNVGFVLETYQTEADGFKRLPNGDSAGDFSIQDFLAKVRFDTGNAASVYQSFELKGSYTDNDSDSSYLGLTDEDFAEDPFQRYAASARDNIQTEHWQIQGTHYAEFSDAFNVTTTAYYNDFYRDWFKLDDIDVGDGRFSPVLMFQPIDRFQSFLSDARGTAVSEAAALAERDAVLDILRGTADSADDALQLRHNARSYFSAGVQTVANFNFATGGAVHDLDVSFRYHEDEEDRLQNRENFAMRGGALVPTSVDPIGSQANRESKANAVSFYAQDRIEWGRWQFVPGIRVEHVELIRLDFATDDPDRLNGPTRRRENDVTAISPGIGVNFEVTDALTLLAGIHRGINPPGVGTTETKEETSTNIEFGFLYERDALRLEAIGFYNDIDDLIGTCSNSVGCVGADIGDQFNSGAVEVKGLEVDAGLDIPLGVAGVVVPLRANYTYTDAEFQNLLEDSAVFGPVNPGDKLPNIPRHQFNIRAGLKADAWSMTMLFNYTGDVRTEAGQGDIPQIFKIEDRVIVDLAADYRIVENVGLFFEAKNLFDKEFAIARRPYGLRTGLPRTVLGGVDVSF